MARFNLAILSVAIGIVMISAAKAGENSNSQVSAEDNPAVNIPDEFAWRLFVEINQSANNGTNDVLWETWANDIPDTFPKHPDPANPPLWPGSKARPKALRPSRKLQLFQSAFSSELESGHAPTHIGASGDSEEVRRNQATFDFIVKNRLWYREGIEQAYQAGLNVNFPADAIEIKAHWKAIEVKDNPRYHWNTDQNGKLFGLIALHISSKALPNWFWTTFEHVDNPNRGKALGIHDSFGVEPPNSLNGKVSVSLSDLFKKSGLGTEWRYYRLDGTQTSFTDSTGRPTLLGNSEIEGPFVMTSSCITCHAKAAADGSGSFLQMFHGTPPEGDIGTPNPDWFFNSQGKPKNIQLDFVWGFLASSRSAGGN